MGLFCTHRIAITSAAATPATPTSAFACFGPLAGIGTRCCHAGLRIDEGRCGQWQLIGRHIVAGRRGARIALLALSASASATTATAVASFGRRLSARFRARITSFRPLAATLGPRAAGLTRGAGFGGCRIVRAFASTPASATAVTTAFRATFSATLTASAAASATPTAIAPFGALAASFRRCGGCCG